MKVIKICIIGYPNSGKSTFLNNIINHKISIVTHKIHTTRDNIAGIINKKNCQLILIDTPGIIKKPKFDLEKKIINKALKELDCNNLACIVIDIKRKLSNNHLLNISYYYNMIYKPIVILNKIDLIKNKRILIKFAKSIKNKGFNNIFMISSLKTNGINDLIKFFIKKSLLKRQIYNINIITTKSVKLLSEDITLEKLFICFNQEIPYSLTVKTELWYDKGHYIIIHQIIFIIKKNQKKILLKNKGALIKKISTLSRNEIGNLLNKKVHLFLFIKVNKNWIKHT